MNDKESINDEAALEALAETFRLLSEPGRLKLLQELKSGEKMVGELVEATGDKKGNVGFGFIERPTRGL